jgi:hypothetical protein
MLDVSAGSAEVSFELLAEPSYHNSKPFSVRHGFCERPGVDIIFDLNKMDWARAVDLVVEIRVQRRKIRGHRFRVTRPQQVKATQKEVCQSIIERMDVSVCGHSG